MNNIVKCPHCNKAFFGARDSICPFCHKDTEDDVMDIFNNMFGDAPDNKSRFGNLFGGTNE